MKNKILAFQNLILTLCFGIVFSLFAGFLISSAINRPDLTVGIGLSIFAVSLLANETKGKLYMAFTQGICQRVQESLISILGSNSPSLRRGQYGYLNALQSPQNLSGVTKIQIDPGNGKKKGVRLTFIQRGLESDVKTTPITNCATEIEPTPFQQDVDITSYLRSPGIKFSEDEMRKLCEGDMEFMSSVVNAQIDALVKVLNKNLLATQNVNFGNFNPNTPGVVGDKKTVILLTGQKRVPHYMGESEILEAFEDLDWSGRPIVVGSGNLSHYVRQVGIGCCNENGINLAQAGAMDYFKDRYVEGIIGANEFIGLVPGMVQLMTWNKYVGTYKKENDVFSHTTITDPVTGLTFDMKWKYNDCDDSYSVHFGIWYDLYFIPTNAFAAGDELEGTNGSLNFAGTVESEYCC